MALSTLLAAAGAAAQAPSSCHAVSPAQAAVLIELYTSEGCNSCPPADRWLSSLRTDGVQLVAAAFHVDYWDRLGWKDRFADPSHSVRQAAQQVRSGARFVYTPQVLVNGRDARPGVSLPHPAKTAAVRIEMQRESDERVRVRVEAGPGAPSKLALWWAVLEDRHATEVKAGENRGVTLEHDHVVRRYREVPAWSAGLPRTDVLDAPRRGEGSRKTGTLVVVTDASDGAPLQALLLGC